MRLFSRDGQKRGKDKKMSVRAWMERLFSRAAEGEGKPRRTGRVKAHLHEIEGMTARADGHKEKISASTGAPIMTKEGHMHEYNGAITVDGKEVHRLNGFTGNAADQDHAHVHKIVGHTSKDGRHSHRYILETSNVVTQSKRPEWRAVADKKPVSEAVDKEGRRT